MSNFFDSIVLCLRVCHFIYQNPVRKFPIFRVENVGPCLEEADVVVEVCFGESLPIFVSQFF